MAVHQWGPLVLYRAWLEWNNANLTGYDAYAGGSLTHTARTASVNIMAAEPVATRPPGRRLGFWGEWWAVTLL